MESWFQSLGAHLHDVGTQGFFSPTAAAALHLFARVPIKPAMTSPSEIASAKRLLREKMMAQRAAMDVAERTEAASKIAETGLEFMPVAPGSTVSAFAAIGDEIDPLPLLTRLHGSGLKLGLPVVIGRGQPLQFRSWSPGEPLMDAPFGLRVPSPEAREVTPEILFVPLLAFDAQGYRLGYGGGYYDRTLATLRAKGSVVAIGLAYDSQEVDAVPHANYDERLDWVLTPSGARRIESS